MSSYKYLKTATLGTVTLDSAYTSGSGSMVLTAGQGARLPSTGDFWIAWSEDQADPDAVIHLWKVTSRSTDTLTVTAEASEGGGDTNVSGGETLRAVMSISALDQLRQDICQTGAYASAAVEKAGALYLPNDGSYILRDTGSVFAPWGPIVPLTQPPTSGYTWGNQGTSTLSTTTGIWHFVPQNAAGFNLRRYMRNTFPTAPYRFAIAMTMTTYAGGRAGIVLFNGTGSVTYEYFQATDATPKINSTNMTNDTTASGSNFGPWNTHMVGIGGLLWIAIRDDNAGTRYFETSRNGGLSWVTVFSESSTDFITPNAIGVYINNDGNADMAFDVYHVLVT